MSVYVKILSVAVAITMLLSLPGCGGEKKRLAGMKAEVSTEYHAQMQIYRSEDKGLALDTVQDYDIATRPSEGHRVVGARIGDKKINYQVIGAGEFEVIEETEYITIKLGREQEFLPTQAGRFRLRFTSDEPIESSASGLFRRRFTFKPVNVWALVEDDKNPEGVTAIPLDEPDLGYIKLDATTAIGAKQPSGGRRSMDSTSVDYSLPSDISKLKPMTFTYFPSRSSFYIGGVLMWVLNRLAWMVLGIVLYTWWRRMRENTKKEMAIAKLRE